MAQSLGATVPTGRRAENRLAAGGTACAGHEHPDRTNAAGRLDPLGTRRRPTLSTCLIASNVCLKGELRCPVTMFLLKLATDNDAL